MSNLPFQWLRGQGLLPSGLQIFMGNANVANLAHPGFMGLGAYLTSIFAMPLVIKKTLIPNAPFGLGEVQLGIAGALYAYYLGTVNARAFYFHAAFLTLAMHILGGMRSVTGAVVGVVLISVAMELIRHLESGPVILGAQLPDLFGLGSLMLGVIIVLVMCLRSDGLMGGLELDEVLARHWKRWRRGG